MPNRAQSEAVGSILVIGLVVVVVGVAGTAALGPITSGTDGVRAEITGGVDTDGITLSHQGGDSISGDELRLIVRVNGSETGLDWADGTLSGGDDAFDPGEGWRVSRDYHADSVVAVTLIHDPSNAVLFDTERNPASTDPVVADRGGNVGARDSEGAVPGGGSGSSPGDGSGDGDDDDGDDDDEDDEGDDDGDEDDEGDDDGDEDDEGDDNGDEDDEDDEDDGAPGNSGSAPGQNR
ncbi:type IV pilin [Haloplanus salinarum]|uniref:type IV pilin n=1 Tax=Haloplanus salinarum TaxID=1912324 RepID=UPI00214B1A42|nr:type IV pilin [Haloplanus salinarum]